ncbi:NAD(P)H-dependent oxidoreductase [Paenibacillus sp. YIM B09110]|uniref:NAD(P)H-dependent oxidoreductase n=1 Tax=Paenibacillus sp. YIM B09110 TaxID=3126102 RepID=UPI00301C1BA1
MKSNILVITGHPDTESFCSALSQAYIEGAKEQAVQVRTLHMGELEFEPNLKFGYRQRTELEADLLKAQELIRWADHIVLVYPVWWGMMPAVMKGFFDRILLPGFAFRYKENSVFFDKLLTGKTARLIVTSDTPSWYNRLIYGRAGHRVVKQSILQFCGIKPVRVTDIGPVTHATAENRKKWLEQAKRMGARLA